MPPYEPPLTTGGNCSVSIVNPVHLLVPNVKREAHLAVPKRETAIARDCQIKVIIISFTAIRWVIVNLEGQGLARRVGLVGALGNRRAGCAP